MKAIKSLGLESIYGQLLENLSKRETPVNEIVQKRLTVAAKKTSEYCSKYALGSGISCEEWLQLQISNNQLLMAEED